MDLGLTGKVILIAGSSRGIGKAIAAAVLEEGAVVCISGRDAASLTAAERELSGKGRVVAFGGDLSQAAPIRAVLDEITAKLGQLDGLVCNLGTGSGKPGWDQPESDWDRLMTLNFHASTRLAQASIPLMLDRGGSIVFVSSVTGLEATSAPLPYGAAKAALLNYSKNLARQVARHKVRVNCVAPGNVLFPGGTWERHLKNDRQGTLERIRAEVAMERFGLPEEIASVVAFLCSGRASFVTGACFVADGGQTRTI